MSVHESGEMYLEAILVLGKSGNLVRSVDVGEYLGYSKPGPWAFCGKKTISPSRKTAAWC